MANGSGWGRDEHELPEWIEPRDEPADPRAGEWVRPVPYTQEPTYSDYPYETPHPPASQYPYDPQHPYEAQYPSEPQYGYEPEWSHRTDPGVGARREPPRGRGRNPEPGWGGGWGGRGGGRPVLPALPTLAIATVLVLLAFILGRATGGGDDKVAAGGTSSTVAQVTTTTTPTPLKHTVQKMESLSTIATKYGLSTNELALFNGIGNVNHVFVGQVLKIPAPGTVTTNAPATTTTTKKKKS